MKNKEQLRIYTLLINSCGARSEYFTLNDDRKNNLRLLLLILKVLVCFILLSTTSLIAGCPTAINAPTISSGTNPVCVGGNVIISETPTGGSSLTYQWQVSTDGGTSWSNLTNSTPYSYVTTSTLTITGATANMQGYQYRVEVLSGSSCGYSSALTLTVNAAPVIYVNPAATSTCVSGTASLTVTMAAGTNLTYQWQESINSGTSWSNISTSAGPNSTGATYSN